MMKRILFTALIAAVAFGCTNSGTGSSSSSDSGGATTNDTSNPMNNLNTNNNQVNQGPERSGDITGDSARRPAGDSLQQ